MKKELPKLTLALAGLIAISYIAFSSRLVFADMSTIKQLGFAVTMPFNIFSFSFVHAGYGHLAANLAMILAAGTIIEARLGKRDLLGLFFLGSAFSALIFTFINREYLLVGASAGAVSLLSAAVAVDPRTAARNILAIAVAAILFVASISIYVELTTHRIESEIRELEATRIAAQQEGDIETLQEAEQQITRKESLKQEIEEGIEVQESVPVNFEIHVYAAIFGALYLFLFRRDAVKGTANKMMEYLSNAG